MSTRDAVDGLAVSELAYGQGEVDRHQQFDRMSAAELRDAERLIDLLLPNLERRRTRRSELHQHGRTVAPRVMFRRSLATGGDVLDWVWRRPVRRPRQLIVICDISGSMERHARVLLRFSQALAASAVRTEAFVFGTRLTRVTRLLRDRDRDRALTRVSLTVSDWSGGTRIGESFRTFNLHWARRVLRSSAVVVVVSDGWDRGDPELVATETARLQRSCHRLIWLNPLASAPGYQPLAAGMSAALPYIDDFVPAGTIASLQRLGVLLSEFLDPAGGRPSRPRPSGSRPDRPRSNRVAPERGRCAATGPDRQPAARGPPDGHRRIDRRQPGQHRPAPRRSGLGFEDWHARADRYRRCLAGRGRGLRAGGRRPNLRLGAAAGRGRPAGRRRRPARRLGQRRLRRGCGIRADRRGPSSPIGPG